MNNKIIFQLYNYKMIILMYNIKIMDILIYKMKKQMMKIMKI